MTRHVDQNALKRIAFGARAESRLFLLALAKEIRNRHGSEIHLYCAGPQQVAYYRNLDQEGLFASITDARILLNSAFDADLDEAEVIKRACRFESITGMTINQMAVPDRHFGRGYAMGGFYHPRSRYSERVDYVHMVHAYCKALEFWDTEFASKQITLCINVPRECAHMARARGIPFRAIAGSRFRGYHYWAWNSLNETPAFEHSWRADDAEADIEMDAPYHAHLANRGRFLRQFSTLKLLRSWSYGTVRRIYWILRGYQKAKGYLYREEMLFHYRVWRDYRRLRRLGLRRLADLEGQRIAYFPMHIEPETALHGYSPEYFYQHALIAAVSRDLPAGCRLVVKEAYGAIGRRPADFYRQIADLKNVVLLDVWESGFECAKRADVVVTICGTAGLEALVAGNPVIAFGRHNIYNFAPSVRVVQDEAMLATYLREAFEGKPDRKTIRKEGQRVLKAIVENSFDMANYDYINLEKFEQAAVDDACDKLQESVAAGAAVTV